MICACKDTALFSNLQIIMLNSVFFLDWISAIGGPTPILTLYFGSPQSRRPIFYILNRSKMISLYSRGQNPRVSAHYNVKYIRAHVHT